MCVGLPYKSLGSERFCFKEINTFIHQDLNKLIKSDSKDIYYVKTIFISNVIAAENSSLHHRNKLHFKIYSNTQ